MSKKVNYISYEFLSNRYEFVFKSMLHVVLENILLLDSLRLVLNSFQQLNEKGLNRKSKLSLRNEKYV